jgi:hypothetical protein
LNSWGINEGFVVFSIKEAEDQMQELKDRLGIKSEIDL